MEWWDFTASMLPPLHGWQEISEDQTLFFLGLQIPKELCCKKFRSVYDGTFNRRTSVNYVAVKAVGSGDPKGLHSFSASLSAVAEEEQ